MAALIRSNRVGERADRRPRRVHAQSRVLHRRAAHAALDVEQARTFLQSPQRVLLVASLGGSAAVGAASGITLEDAGRGSISEHREHSASDVAAARSDQGDRDGIAGDEPVSLRLRSATERSSRIQDPVRIERRLDPLHQRDLLGGELDRQIARLGEADAVLAADRAFERDDALEQLALGLRRPRALLPGRRDSPSG